MKANETPRASCPCLYTIGHSTRPLEKFIQMLQAHAIELLADIRTVPRSRHNPQYESQSLRAPLERVGIAYLHEPALGGLRRPRKDSTNAGWRNASFRGFADYMQTEEFARALDGIIALGRERRAALMCAEGNPFRCHRSLVADALLARGLCCEEIASTRTTRPHRLTPFAVIEGSRVWYPASGPSALPACPNGHLPPPIGPSGPGSNG